MQKIGAGSSSGKCRELTKDAAEAMAVEVLSFLAENRAHLDRFLALSGLSPENLRAAANEPQFLAALLDYLLADEAALSAFAAKSGHEAAAIVRAQQLLSPHAELP
jgi:Protein of unknown function (DUF3572)